MAVVRTVRTPVVRTDFKRRFPRSYVLVPDFGQSVQFPMEIFSRSGYSDRMRICRLPFDNARSLRTCLLFLLFVGFTGTASAQSTPYFGIQVVDEQTGRGIPLVTLTSTNFIRLITDSAGWVALNEPGLMNREVWFSVESPGYEYPKDGFGYAGIRATPVPGKTLTVKMRRTQIAERLYRITGQGIYGDSLLLKKPVPIPDTLAGSVVGQDSVQAVPYRGRIFWLWGDTSLPQYPLGIFQVTAAWSDLPEKGGMNPLQGVRLHYLEEPEKKGQARKAAPGPEPGPVWLFGMLTVPDETGKERLVAHYTRQKSLEEVVEHGLMVFNDEKGIFERLVVFDLKRMWQSPRGNAVRIRNEEGDYFYFAAPFCYTRVRATLTDLKNQDRYEALTYAESTGGYHWQSTRPPTEQKDEMALRKAGKIKPEQCRYLLKDVQSGAEVQMHGASIAWNAYRKRWVMVGHQIMGKASMLGEVWYAESDSPQGPWTKAVHIATHPNYSFYNVRHHAFFDQEGGRYLFFEGTYTATFSTNLPPTPRYEYNQLMYRLDLKDMRLQPAR